MSDPLQKLRNALESTGFLHEYKVNKILEDSNWQVINNRYYEDDLTSTPREIDLIAYKARKIDEVQHYFVLIISCKKSDEENWVFFTRDYLESDMNTVHYPAIVWSNDKILTLMTAEDSFGIDYEKLVNGNEGFARVARIRRNSFAFQQVSANTFKKRDDASIYGSVISTIKAAEYERKHLPKRKQHHSCYTFELVSVFDGKMFEAYCQADNMDLAETDSAKYKNRFIIGGQDNVYRVNFYTLSAFERALGDYEETKEAMFSFQSDRRRSFYGQFFSKREYQNLFREELKGEVGWMATHFASKAGFRDLEIEGLHYDQAAKEVHIETNTFDDKVLAVLNSKKQLLDSASSFLKKYYGYTGKVVFSDDIPF